MAEQRPVRCRPYLLFRVTSSFVSLTIVLLTLCTGPVRSSPFDYLLSPSSSRIHVSLGVITPTTVTFDTIRAVSDVALSGGFGFELPLHYPLALAIDADLHDFSAFKLHTRFLAVSAGAKYALTMADHQTILKPLLTLGLGYLSDREMPFNKKVVYIIRSGVDLNLPSDTRLRWLVSSSVLFFPALSPGRPKVVFTPLLMLRVGLIL